MRERVVSIDISKSFGGQMSPVLRSMREEASLSQKVLAERLGWKLKTIQTMESLETAKFTKHITLEMVFRYAEKCGVVLSLSET